MKIKKTVTDKQLAANRRNAKLSTGPKTEDGKKNAKFNAVKYGLFAKHLFIPDIDESSPAEFSNLLTDLSIDLDAEGPIEEFFVAEIGKAMIRMQRAVFAERGSVRTGAMWVNLPPKISEGHQRMADRLTVLEEAQNELRTTGTVSQATYSALLPLLDKADRKILPQAKPFASDWKRPAEDLSSAVHAFHDQLSDALNRQSTFMREFVDQLSDKDQSRLEDHVRLNSIPFLQMSSILRYEKAAEKKIE